MEIANCVVIGCTLIAALLTAGLAVRSREHRGLAWYVFVFAAVLSLIGAIAAVFQGVMAAAAEARSRSALAIVQDSLNALEQTVLPRNIEQANTGEAISQFKGIHVLLSHADDKEAAHTAGEIESLAKRAGWSVDRESNVHVTGTGIGVFTSPGKSMEGDQSRSAARELVKQLKQQSKVTANTGTADKRLSADTVRVYVAPLPTREESGLTALQKRAKRLVGWGQSQQSK